MVGASNVYNQIIEKNLDVLMDRTKNRPIPSGRMSVQLAFIIAVSLTIIGIIALYIINPITAMFGSVCIFMYVSLYTPLKTKTPLSVFVGAFPGAIPFMLGWVAATGSFGIEPGTLFMIQFFWQFPHFWAIAWLAHDDYQKAGYFMLPFRAGRTKQSAWQIFVYTLFCIPASLLPWALPSGDPMVGNIALIVAVLCGLLFAVPAFRLHQTLDMKHARTLMFASFAYLPIVQLAFVLDKI